MQIENTGGAVETIDYHHAHNLHTVQGATPVMSDLTSTYRPRSLLDVGCGIGTWLRAALDQGVDEVLGLDGVVPPSNEFLVPKELLRFVDFRGSWNLGRTFDVALCLEVAEHLEATHAKQFIEMLSRHSDLILFSAAIPNQGGQHHVNCQWPSYWQSLFNDLGFVCSDPIRWRHWNDVRIEPWYRQNMFLAERNSTKAGLESRLEPVIHPAMLEFLEGYSPLLAERIRADGVMPIHWYLQASVNAVFAKLRRIQIRKEAP